MASHLHRVGWDILAWNYRGCGHRPNRLLRSYHSGESLDLRHVIHHAAQSHPHIALIGFSLGGNLALKCASEQPAHPNVRTIVAISAPIHIPSTAHVLDTAPRNHLYRQRFLRTLRANAIEKAARFPGQLDPGVLARVSSLREFDERYTAPIHGFRDAADYYEQASALPHLPHLRTPSLLLNAQDDPLLCSPSIPFGLAASHEFLHLEAPAHGGHVGFHQWSRHTWHEQRTLEFLASQPTGG